MLRISQLRSDSWDSKAGLYSRASLHPLLATASCCLLEATAGSLVSMEGGEREAWEGQIRHGK